MFTHCAQQHNTKSEEGENDFFNGFLQGVQTDESCQMQHCLYAHQEAASEQDGGQRRMRQNCGAITCDFAPPGTRVVVHFHALRKQRVHRLLYEAYGRCRQVENQHIYCVHVLTQGT
jgi:hypothetical protein